LKYGCGAIEVGISVSSSSSYPGIGFSGAVGASLRLLDALTPASNIL
jgi:hypothetical protein